MAVLADTAKRGPVVATAGAAVADLPGDMDALQDALVRAHDLWRRSPGGGAWPFAGDGPWHLIQGEAGDYTATTESVIEGADGKLRPIRVSETVRPRVPLDAAEVAERDRVTAWLQLVPDAQDRRIVWLATMQLHRGEGRVAWVELARTLRDVRHRATLARRYAEGLAQILCALNGWPVRRAKALAEAMRREKTEDFRA